MFGLENFFGSGVGGSPYEETKKEEVPMDPLKKAYMDAEIKKAKEGGYYTKETDRNLSEVYDLRHAHDHKETEAEKEARLESIREQMERIEKVHPEINLPEAEIRKQMVKEAAHSLTSGERGSRTPDHIN